MIRTTVSEEKLSTSHNVLIFLFTSVLFTAQRPRFNNNPSSYRYSCLQGMIAARSTLRSGAQHHVEQRKVESSEDRVLLERIHYST